MTNLKLAVTKKPLVSALASTLTCACLACGSGANPGGAADGVGDVLSAPPAAHPGHAVTSRGVTAAPDAGAESGTSGTTSPGAGSSTPEAGAPAPEAGSAPPVATQAGRMPLISGGLPAYASYASSPASNAVDADYRTVWRTGHDPSPGDPNWIALDLSSVPVASRTSVYSVWFNEYGYNYDTSDGPSYTLPGDFTIEANAGPGGGPPPTAGWTTLVTKTGNRFSSGANLLDLTGYEWVRFDCRATATNAAPENTDTSLQWGLYDAHAGNDGWKFGGDSITANSMGHQLTNDSFDQLVHARVANDPAFEMAGHGGWSTATELANIDAFLADFPGRYYGLSLGTNDAPGNDPPAYLANMTQLVDTVLAAGKVPVIPTIPYTGDPAHATIPAYNAQIQTLYATYGAKLVHGPDLYAVIYAGRATMFTNPTDLHPNAVGNAAIRQAWAAAMLANVYGQ